MAFAKILITDVLPIPNSRAIAALVCWRTLRQSFHSRALTIFNLPLSLSNTYVTIKL